MRKLALVLALGAVSLASAAVPAAFTVLSDELDAGAPTATLPQGPVDQALADLAAVPGATVLVPRRLGARDGARYALAAWRSEPKAAEWDALLVVALPSGARLLEVTSTSRDVEATLDALLAHAFGSAPPAPPKPAPKVEARLPMPERFDLRYVVLLERVPEYVPPPEPAASAVFDAHIQYQLRLQRDGIAVAGGPFADGEASPALVGMTVLRVKDLATAEAIAAADPAVSAGRLKATVKTWNVPAGELR